MRSGSIWGLAVDRPLGGVALAQTGDTIRTSCRGNERIEDLTVESYLALGRREACDSNASSIAPHPYATGLFCDVRSRGSAHARGSASSRTRSSSASTQGIAGSTRRCSSRGQLRPRVDLHARLGAERRLEHHELYRRNGRYAASVEPRSSSSTRTGSTSSSSGWGWPAHRVTGISFIGNENSPTARFGGYRDRRARLVPAVHQRRHL